MKTGAKFSKCRKYRYSLWRIWNEELPLVAFIGLNPSTADETKNNPTIKRCISFSKEWGFGGVYVINLFAYRATFPKDLLAYPEPIGSRNISWIKKICEKCSMVIGAWGNDGSHLNQSEKVIQLIPNMFCLNVNKSGHPAHPLYQKSTVKPKKLVITESHDAT
ncbi:MAG: hypothetical protein COA79_02570 [Planctomycetota bacterium]|nr:MAG: hypothetical protein COA79_02570 [Planctomycetota bacterium]